MNIVKVNVVIVTYVGFVFAMIFVLFTHNFKLEIAEVNKDFVINMIEYMLDDGSILESRSKEIKLRLLDAVKTKDEKTKWQFINVGLPVVLLAIFGIIYHYIRRKRFTS